MSFNSVKKTATAVRLHVILPWGSSWFCPTCSALHHRAQTSASTHTHTYRVRFIKTCKELSVLLINLSPPCPLLNLSLVALLQGPQVAEEAHGEAAPPLGLRVLGQAVQQDPCVPGTSQQPQDLHLWEDIRLQGKHSAEGHLSNATLRPVMWVKQCEEGFFFFFFFNALHLFWISVSIFYDLICCSSVSTGAQETQNRP